MDFADEQGKRILLVVENLNMILGQQIAGDGAWVVRHVLLNEPRLMLVGTATSRFEEIENAGKAMYDLFKIHDLKAAQYPRLSHHVVGNHTRRSLGGPCPSN